MYIGMFNRAENLFFFAVTCLGAGQDEIRSSYKRLALRWHPDKHNNSVEATQVRSNFTEYLLLLCCVFYVSFTWLNEKGY